ncbi:glycolate oxidase subunit GlcD [Chromatiales bacterium (ex Bugula neritina AB1)]|nr:glycolate oxidase subunit GlcD [Chromatiales bacterium (ex Bugula neritina AB1)]
MSSALFSEPQTPLDESRRKALVSEFLEILPNESVLHVDEDLLPYESDGLSVYRQKPPIVVLPDSVEQVQTILRICSAQGIPVVARGAGTGLSGGALPLANGIVLGMAKFNRILEIDKLARTAVVQPGVRNLAISEAASDDNLYYAPDPSSQIACTIGGNVAENSGGVHCLKYGLTVHNVLQVKAVTMQGNLVTFGSTAPDTPGYDLLGVLHGSEGMLAVTVEITVKLLPKPASTKLLMAAFASVEQAGNAVAAIIASGIIPAGLEMMDKPAIIAAEAFARCGYPTDAEALFLCELDGTEEEVTDQLDKVEKLIRNNGVTQLHIAKDETERMLLWKGRKSAFPAVGRLSPDYYCIDGTIPRRHLSTVLQRMNEWSEEYGLRIANVFHAGDGNLHPLILFDGSIEGELERTEELGGKILELCVEVGGTITGEHGVGMEKINQMCVQFGSDEITQFHALKNAFDPNALLNPGKAIPTLNRCAEFGALHVHHGELPHPDIERF